MEESEMLARAKAVIGEENIVDYRPAVLETHEDTMLDGICVCVPNTIMIWLKNGDAIWYRAEEGDRDEP